MMKKFLQSSAIKLALIAFVFLLSVPDTVRAQIVAFAPPASTSGFGTSPFAATTANANLNVGGLTRGAGVTTSGTAAGGGWGGNGFTTVAGATQDYTFTIEAKSGYTVSLSSFNLRYRRSASGPNSFNLEYSLNGGAYVSISAGVATTSTSTSGANITAPVSLTGVAALQNVPNGTIIKIRMHPQGATSTGGTYYVYGTGIAVAGTVNVAAPSNTPPDLNTPSFNTITYNSATLGANVADSGTSSITSRGIVWSYSANPQVDGPGVTTIPVSGTTGTFSAPVTGFNPLSTVHFRGYAINATDTGYTNDTSFVTLTRAPLISTPTHTGITQTDAVLGANVTDEGASTLTVKGIVWSTTANPAIGLMGTTQVNAMGTSTGVFTTAVTGLPAGTQIYYRGFAANATDTVYTSDATFNTQAATPVTPTVSAPTFTSVTTTSATLGANVTDSGATALVNTGIVWSISANPVIGAMGVTQVNASGPALGIFTVNVTGLPVNTTIYFKGFAANVTDTVYTNDTMFNTMRVLPAISAPRCISFTQTTAVLEANVTDSGSSSLVATGFIWSTNANPVIGQVGVTQVNKPTPNVIFFSMPVLGLPANTVIHFRGFAINANDTVYTADSMFKTLPFLPVVTSPTYASVTNSSATLGANVTDSGSTALAQTGIVWSTSANPVIGGVSVTKINTMTAALGTFTVNATGLPANTTIYFRGFAINAHDTAYTTDSMFNTLRVLPAIVAPTYTSITATSATLGANVTDSGSAALSQTGIVWSTSANPVIGGMSVTKINTMTAALGTFTVNATGLPANTTIYFRGFAINANDTVYTVDSSFKTLRTLPVMTGLTLLSFTDNHAVLEATVSDSGSSSLVSVGFIWSTSSNPVIGGMGVGRSNLLTPGLAYFSMSITGLPANTMIYVKGFAINADDTIYTGEVSFKTLPALPAISAPTYAAVTLTSATLGANVTDSGSTAVSQTGIVWSANANPAIGAMGSTKVNAATAALGTFTVNVTGLPANTTIHFKGFVINADDTVYTTDSMFNTLVPVPPSITAPAYTSITHNSATLGADVTDSGSVALTSTGIVWSTTANPKIGDAGAIKVNAMSATLGVFTISVTGLPANSTIHFRGFAINMYDTAYTADSSFNTLTPPPTAPALANPTVSGITTTSATLGADVTYAGTSAITSRGIVWSTAGVPVIGQPGTTRVNATGTTGVFTVSVSSLPSSSLIHFRGFAINNTDTSYTSDSTFTTHNNIATAIFRNNATGLWSTASIWEYNYTGNLWTSAGVIPGATNPVIIDGNNEVSKNGGLVVGTDCMGLTVHISNRLTINGDLTLNTGTTVNNYGTIGVTGSIINNGTLTHLTGSSISFEGINQTIPAGTYEGITVSGGGNKTLAGAVAVKGIVRLMDGIIVSTSTNMFTFDSTATVANGSLTSYINGPARKITYNGAPFTFHIGTTDRYRTVTIAPSTLNPTSFTASYTKATPANATALSGLTNISTKEYFTINRTMVAAFTPSDAFVTLSWGDSSGVTDTASLRVARFDGTNWVSEGKTNVTGDNVSGTITSAIVSNFSPFTLGSVNPAQPLPVKLIAFEAHKANASNELTWTTSGEQNNSHFEVERSTNGISFETIGTVTGKGHSSVNTTYHFTDAKPFNGTAYYRLKQVDFNGDYTYSKVVSVADMKKDIALQLYPNPANDLVHLSLNRTADAASTVTIIGQRGEVISTVEMPANTKEMSIDLSGLSSGIYIIRITGAVNSSSKVIRN